MKLGIILTTFNRPQYLRRCLESFSEADIPDDVEILIVDDASTNSETIQLVSAMKESVIYKQQNRSVKHSLLIGCDFLFNSLECDIVTNIDSDAIMRKDFISVLMGLRERFHHHIITGFNCLTKNRDGSERHKVLESGEGYNMKQSVGGINMLFDKSQYEKWIRPALLQCLNTQGNWDHQSCIRSMHEGKPIVCSVPSVIQHIGIEESAMRHSLTEPPDVADDFISNQEEEFFIKSLYDVELPGPTKEERAADLEKVKNFSITAQEHPVGFTQGGGKFGAAIKEFGEQKYFDTTGKIDELPKFAYINKEKFKLENVTLVGADCVQLSRLLRAADYACSDIEFGAVKLFSNLATTDSRVIKINPIVSKSDYSWFIMKELAKYIETDFILIIQHDGFPLNVSAWRNEWFSYDYIGAPWEWYPDKQVGNGGFSFRSRHLHDILMHDEKIIPINEPGVTRNKEEDHCICRLYRDYLESHYGIKFAPLHEARRFSIEGWKVPNPTWTNEFGFHGRSVNISKSNIIL